MAASRSERLIASRRTRDNGDSVTNSPRDDPTAAGRNLGADRQAGRRAATLRPEAQRRSTSSAYRRRLAVCHGSDKRFWSTTSSRSSGGVPRTFACTVSRTRSSASSWPTSTDRRVFAYSRRWVDDVGLGIRRTAGSNLGSDQLGGTLALKTTQIRADKRQPAAQRPAHDLGAVRVLYSCRCWAWRTTNCRPNPGALLVTSSSEAPDGAKWRQRQSGRPQSALKTRRACRSLMTLPTAQLERVHDLPGCLALVKVTPGPSASRVECVSSGHWMACPPSQPSWGHRSRTSVRCSAVDFQRKEHSSQTTVIHRDDCFFFRPSI